MKKTNVIIGIVIFAVLVTVPFWSMIFSSSNGASPEISFDTPAINQLSGDDYKCVEDVEYMRAHHMDLLNDWKVEVVRNGNRMYVATDGTEYLASLQNTCLVCHSNYDDFCLACHTYNDVDPSCWKCHVEPNVAKIASVGGAR